MTYKKSRLCNWIWCLVTIALIAAAIVVAVVLIKNKKSSSSGGSSPSSNSAANYTESLRMALTFMDIQKCKFCRPYSAFQCFSFTEILVSLL